jgi:hypothetical protein
MGTAIKGIMRIPTEENSLESIVMTELNSLRNSPPAPHEDIHWQLMELLQHDKDDSAIATCLDWAMQIRERMGLSWAISVEIAMILYYG